MYKCLCTKTKKKTADEMFKANGSIKILFATEAYSMGTDAPNVRHVVHYGPPSTIEGF